MVQWQEPVYTLEELDENEKLEQEYEPKEGYLLYIGQQSFVEEEYGVVLNNVVGVVERIDNMEVIVLQIEKLKFLTPSV